MASGGEADATAMPSLGGTELTREATPTLDHMEGSVHEGDLDRDIDGDLDFEVTGSVLGRVGGDVLAAVGGDIEGHVGGSVKAAVGGTVHDVGEDVKADVDAIGGWVGGRVRGNVDKHLEGAVGDGVQGSVGGDLAAHVEGSVHAEVRGSVTGDVSGDLEGSVGQHVDGSVAGRLDAQVAGDAKGVGVGLGGTVGGHAHGDFIHELDGEVEGDVHADVGELSGVVHGSVYGNVDALSGSVGGNVEGYATMSGGTVGGEAQAAEWSSEMGTAITWSGGAYDPSVLNDFDQRTVRARAAWSKASMALPEWVTIDDEQIGPLLKASLEAWGGQVWSISIKDHLSALADILEKVDAANGTAAGTCLAALPGAYQPHRLGPLEALPRVLELVKDALAALSTDKGGEAAASTWHRIALIAYQEQVVSQAEDAAAEAVDEATSGWR